MSAVKTVIPDSVRQKFHEVWSSLKKKETEHLCNDDVSDAVEMVGWGVEKAQERNQEEASMLHQRPPPLCILLGGRQCHFGGMD